MTSYIPYTITIYFYADFAWIFTPEQKMRRFNFVYE